MESTDMPDDWYGDGEDDAPDVELVKQALRNLIAIERDRLMGYPSDELHMSPRKAMENGMVALEELGEDATDVVWEGDRERIGLENPWDDFTDGEGPELV
jgi:hypothetical protein